MRVVAYICAAGEKWALMGRFSLFIFQSMVSKSGIRRSIGEVSYPSPNYLRVRGKGQYHEMAHNPLEHGVMEP